MKRISKKLVLTCFGFIVIGIGLSLLGYHMGGTFSFSFSPDTKFLTADDIKNATKLIEQETAPFTGIDICSDTMNVEIRTGDSYSISYLETPYILTDYSVENGILTVVSNAKVQFFNFSLDFEPKEYTLTITVPENTELNTLFLQSKDNDCLLENQTADILSLETAYGDLSIANCTVNTGTIESQDGSITINGLTAAKTVLTLDYGNLTITDSPISQLSAKMSDGDCKIILTDDIDNYSLALESTDGYITIDGTETQSVYRTEKSGENTIQITNHYGDIDIFSGK